MIRIISRYGLMAVLLSLPIQWSAHATFSTLYDKIFPYYLEVCSGAKMHIKKNDAQSGPGGHSVMYLKGATLDKSAPYPRLVKLDKTKVDLSDPNSGVGLSASSVFSNVNFVAIPGKDLFYFGGHQEGEVIDKAFMERVRNRFKEENIFKGVEVHQKEMKPGISIEDTRVGRNFGTDFALQIARRVYCVKIPLSEDMLDKAIAHLNGVNDYYALGGRTYQWNLLKNNCSHLARNTLAAMGVLSAKPVESTGLNILLNFTGPANQLVKSAMNVRKQGVDSVLEVFNDIEARSRLWNSGVLYPIPGALAEERPMVTEKNEVYNDTGVLIPAGFFLFHYKNKILKKLYRQSRYIILRENLEESLRHYQDSLENLYPVESYFPNIANGEREVFVRFYQKYLNTVQSNIAMIQEALREIRSDPAMCYGPFLRKLLR